MAGVVEVVDVSPLRGGGDTAAAAAAAARLVAAARDVGFLYAAGHGVRDGLRAELEAESRRFFALPRAAKDAVAMRHGGRAWRGWFPVGGEITSGVADQKEGLYFGTEGAAGDPRPLHGPNLWPAAAPRLRPLVTEWMREMAALGADLVAGFWRGMGLPAAATAPLFADPTCLFRIFSYPPPDPARWGPSSIGVGEHTDYGFLTILAAAEPGLEVRAGVDGAWVPVPPKPGCFIINIGDALERATGGLLRATAHRVRREPGAARPRVSLPFFFDPGWGAPMRDLSTLLPPPLSADAARRRAARPRRWDGTALERYEGTYGGYLLAKVAKVFPDLAQEHQVGAGGDGPAAAPRSKL